MPALIGFPASDEVYPGPTTFLAGDRSNYIRPRDQEPIVTHFPTARLQEVADSGHWPHAEQPARFLALVRPLLDG